ncbi:hypothetical protein CEXT_376241 [Caerostris extrusa]|uniref:Uncharacterized protein n=1 Tax=Caerostris extrusa TaxID=172846 RepID=A0AAV4NJ70_CAEEX|nr:hypothetical protein CEXT_376241 [Caerostris extrusa]
MVAACGRIRYFVFPAKEVNDIMGKGGADIFGFGMFSLLLRHPGEVYEDEETKHLSVPYALFQIFVAKYKGSVNDRPTLVSEVEEEETKRPGAFVCVADHPSLVREIGDEWKHPGATLILFVPNCRDQIRIQCRRYTCLDMISWRLRAETSECHPYACSKILWPNTDVKGSSFFSTEY